MRVKKIKPVEGVEKLICVHTPDSSTMRRACVNSAIRSMAERSMLLNVVTPTSSTTPVDYVILVTAAGIT